MARPTDRDEAKTAFLNIRVTPSFKEQIEALARIEGRKMAAWAEDHLLRSVEQAEARRNQSPQTAELLAELERLIGEIETATGKQWHQGVGTWAAVAEMLATGPIMERAPAEISSNDAKLQRQFAAMLETTEAKQGTLDKLALFNLPKALLGTFAPPLGGREQLRQCVEVSGLADALKDNALALVDELEALDARGNEAWEAIDKIIQPFEAAAREGRSLYPKPRRGMALETLLTRLNPSPLAALLATAPVPQPVAPTRRTGMFGSGRGFVPSLLATQADEEE